MRQLVWLPILLLAGMASLFSGCQTTEYLSNKNLEYLYNDKEKGPRPELHIFHPSKERSKLFVKVPTEDLAFSGSSGAEARARFRITYRIYKNYEYRTLFDSSQAEVSITKDRLSTDAHTTAFRIPKADQYYLVAVKVKDLVAERDAQAFLYYRPYSQAGDQYYLVKKAATSQLHMKPYLPKNQQVRIEPTNDADSLLVSRYNAAAFRPAAPPFEEDYTNKELFGLNPDSTFTIASDQPISFSKAGFYGIKAIGGESILPLRVTGSAFPELKQPRQLRQSIRYITSKSNYEELKAKPAKAAVDEFWLARANRQKDQAREMIQQYYQRVQQANEFFTTYKKGWKTDRGLIYTIFGKPYIVYRTNTTEVWIYPNKNSLPTLEFRFDRRDHALAPVYFELQRSRFYEDPFYKAVEQLRESPRTAQ